MASQRANFVWVIMGLLGVVLAGTGPETSLPGGQTASKGRPVLLLVDEDQHPTIEISWVVDGQRESFTATLPYTAPIGGEPIGHNVKCYVALGGTRVDTGAGHPKGALIRLGITKVDSSRAFFAGIDPHTDLEMSVTGVRFNQPVKYNPETGLMHLKYGLGDLQACSLPGTARNQYLLSDPSDTLGGRVKPGINATPGALDGKDDGQIRHGEITIEIDPDDPSVIAMHIRVPYGLLRHLQDPWKSDLPGTFFEPVHMHAEAELIPIDAEPLARNPIAPESNTDLPED